MSRLEELATGYKKIKAKCQYFGECGGCLMQDLEYPDQVELKRALVNRAFETAGMTERLLKKDVLLSPETWYYRNRMDFPVGEDGEIGMKPYGKWRDVLDLKDCYIMSREAPKILQLVRDWMNAYELQGWNAVRHAGFIRYVVIREGKNTNERMVMIVTSAMEHDEKIWPELVRRLKSSCTSIMWGINPEITDLSIPQDIRTLYGPEFLTEKINAFTYKIYPSSFFQTNSNGAALLQNAVGEIITGKKVLDLYCGMGFFSIDFAARGKKVLGVEIDERAIEVARDNALVNKVKADFHASSVEEWLKTGGDDLVKAFKPATIVLDPPRMGLHPRVLEWVTKQTAPELIYVSCNFEQFVREYGLLKKTYVIDSLSAVDMFPHTPHIELIFKLKLLKQKKTKV